MKKLARGGAPFLLRSAAVPHPREADIVEYPGQSEHIERHNLPTLLRVEQQLGERTRRVFERRVRISAERLRHHGNEHLQSKKRVMLVKFETCSRCAAQSPPARARCAAVATGKMVE
eukprot:1765358-Prymnesium_polylepis.1